MDSGGCVRVLSDRQLNTISECESYAKNILDICNDLRIKGETDKSITKFPKSELLEIIGVKPKETKKLIGDELHNYLKSKIRSDICTEDIPIPQDFVVAKNIEIYLNDMPKYLSHGNEILKTREANLFGLYLRYGMWLNIAFELFEHEKGCNKVKGTWPKWLQQNIGITDRYVRELRALASDFGAYKKIHQLSITLTEFRQIKLQIKTMLSLKKEITDFWMS